MRMKLANPKDFAGGALMLAIGLATAWQASSYDLGSLRRMGPGFFPMALGVILSVAGALIILTSRRQIARAKTERLPSEWRGWFCICAGLAAFIILGTYGGLMPATFVCVFVAALGDKRNTFISSLVLALAMSLVAAIVFWWLLQVQFPLFRWG